jgi:hypothetical protein
LPRQDAARAGRAAGDREVERGAAGWLGQGKIDEAAQLRAAAFEAAPAVSGTMNGEPFDWIADADVRLGPVCEAMLNGKYYWIPFERLSRIDIEAPSDLRDLIWAPAKLTFQNGGEQVAFLPARYPGSGGGGGRRDPAQPQDRWRGVSGADTHVGLGQRMFATDVGETALLEARSRVEEVIRGPWRNRIATGSILASRPPTTGPGTPSRGASTTVSELRRACCAISPGSSTPRVRSRGCDRGAFPGQELGAELRPAAAPG